MREENESLCDRCNGVRGARGYVQSRHEFRVKEFDISSALTADTGTLWRHATTPAGINREFRPLLRMTFPRDVEDLTSTWQPGQRLFRSWLLLGGMLPVEYDDIALKAVEPGRRFLESSSLFSQRVWEHERVFEPILQGGCTVTDRVRFEPRLPWLAPVYLVVFKAVFRWRHRNLRALFGRAPVDTGNASQY